MKIQLVLLALFVIATMAHRHGDDDENQVGARRHYRGRRRNDNQIAANAEDAELEDSVSSSDDNTTERSHRRGCWSRRGGKRGERKGARRPENDGDFDVRHGEESDNGDDRQHDSEWHEKHGVPMPDGESNVGRHHHRHHHHRHHHHHRNRTTTAPTTTTTSTAVPSLFDNE